MFDLDSMKNVDEQSLKQKIESNIKEINSIWENNFSLFQHIINPLKILFKQLEIYIWLVSKRQSNDENKYVF